MLWLKYFKTLCLCLAFLSLGISIALVGPTLPTLAYNLNVNIESISVILPARGFGYLVGSIISGFVFGKIDVHLMIFVAMTLMAGGMLSTPFWNYVILMAISLSTTGVAMGFLDTAGNVLCLQTWGEKSGPFMQMLHFSFAVGTTIAPLAAQPFLVNEVPTNNSASSNHNSLTNKGNKSNFLLTTSSASELTSHAYEVFPIVTYAFVIASVFALVVALSFLCLACCFVNNSVSDQTDTIKEEGWNYRLKMLALLFIFFLVYVGTEVTFGVYIFSFAIHCTNHYSKDDASLLNTIFWAFFAFGRLIAIPASKFFKPSTLLHFDLIGTVVAALLLCFFPHYANSAEPLLWFAVGLYGISMASVFPTGISWAEQYITVNGKAAVALVVGAALGEMICPFIIGQFIEYNPMNLMYFCLVCASLSVLNYLAMRYLANTRGKRLKQTLELEEKLNGEEANSLMNKAKATNDML